MPTRRKKQTTDDLKFFVNKKLTNHFKMQVKVDEVTLRVIILAMYGGCETVWLNGEKVELAKLGLTLNLEYPKSNMKIS